MIEQSVALEAKKGPGISRPGSLKYLPSETNVEKRAYTSIKSDEE